jgi:hypothetical protein
MEKWREIGEELFEYLKAEQWAADLWREARWNERKQKRLEPDLLFALQSCARGNSDRLIEYVESDKEFSLSRDERDRCARVLRHKPWAPRLGRRPDGVARFALSKAQAIFSVWKEANKQSGISDWGLRDQMKDQACRYAIDICRPYIEGREPDFETVRQLMERSKKRQASRRGPSPQTPPK